VASHGFSPKEKHPGLGPDDYDYANASTATKWPPLAGTLTNFGPVDELIRQWDDQMVVIAGGDEVRMRVSVPPEPPPHGWVRDFVLHAVGWDKDADLNTLAGQSVGPLPFKDMVSYPPSVFQAFGSEKVVDQNRSHRSRRQEFRAFWHR
ncbi:MAG: hypothetical protein AAF664_16945, partial [Planctomycetota bacterium]